MLLREFDLDMSKLSSGDVKEINANVESLSLWIKDHCSEFLKMKGANDLVRGVRENSPSIFMGYPRKNRRSIEGEISTELTKIVDKYMQMTGFTALRGNSLFCNSDPEMAEPWGELYVIFPINGFTFAYSKRHTCCSGASYIFPTEAIDENLRTYVDQISDFWNRKKYDVHGYSENIKKFLKYWYTLNEFYSKKVNYFNITTVIRNIIKTYNSFTNDEKVMLSGSVVDRAIIDLGRELKQLGTDEIIAKKFIVNNKLTNKNLKWALENSYDVWIHGAYIAIDRELYIHNFDLFEKL